MADLELIFFDAGGGHRSAATALRVAMESERSWRTRLVNLQELLDSLDLSRKITGVRLQDSYNLMLRKNWTLGSGRMLQVLHTLIRLYHGAQVDLFEKHWRDALPDLAVSLVPHFNRALLEGLRRVTRSVPFITILTDLADYPPHFWIERQEQFFICGTERAAQQARLAGIPEECIYRTSGMIVHPRFYQPITLDRRAERQRLGLDPDLATGFVMFGGQGSRAMLEIVRRLDQSDCELQLILICGRNERLANALRRREGRLRCLVEGFTAEVPRYMFLSDFFIGKPGPGSISEALLMQLPVIVERNPRTLPQERFNADWIVEKQVGIATPSFREIAGAVRALLSPGTLARYRANAAALNNRAVFECVEILRQILESGGAQASG
jgi:hypothetical protein